MSIRCWTVTRALSSPKGRTWYSQWPVAVLNAVLGLRVGGEGNLPIVLGEVEGLDEPGFPQVLNEVIYSTPHSVS